MHNVHLNTKKLKFAIAFVVMTVVTSLMMFTTSFFERQRNETSDFSEGWKTGTGSVIDINKVDTLDPDDGVVLTKVLPDTIQHNDSLCFIGNNAVLKVYIDDEPVYHFERMLNYSGYGYGTAYNSINLTPDMAGKTVRIELKSAFRNGRGGRLRMMSIEPEKVYKGRFAKGQIIPYIVSVTISIIGVFLMLMAILLNFVGERLRLFMLGLTALLIGIWLANDTCFWRLVADEVKLSRDIDYLFMHMWALPLGLFVYLVTKERKRIFVVLTVLFFLFDTTILLTMRFAFDRDMSRLFMIVAVYMVASAVLMTVMIVSDSIYCRRHNISQNITYFYFGFAIIAVTGLLDMIIYLTGTRSVTGRGNFTRVGAVAFFVTLAYGSIKSLMGEQATVRRERFINKMLQFAVSANDPEVSIRAIMEYFGREFKAAHVYIFENRNNGTFHNTYEWFRPGAHAPENDSYHDLPYEGLIDVLYDIFKTEHRMILDDSENTRELNPYVCDLLKEYNICRTVLGPLEYNGELIGFFGLDDAPEKYSKEIADIIWLTAYFITSLLMQRNEKRDLLRYSYYDTLTGARNRRAMVEFELDCDKSQPYGFVMCDINGLKIENDTLGHEAGDMLIIDVAQSLIDIFGTDNVYRLGGDEFVVYVFYKSKAEFDAMVKCAENLIKAKGRSASIGAVYSMAGDEDHTAVKEKADELMYQQKEEYYKGRNDRRTYKRKERGTADDRK